MKFIIKTELGEENKIPKEAQVTDVILYDIRYLTKAQCNEKYLKWGNQWKDHDEKHEVISDKGIIRRILGTKKEYVLEINTLEEMIKLANDYDDLTISSSNLYEQYPVLYIDYDFSPC